MSGKRTLGLVRPEPRRARSDHLLEQPELLVVVLGLESLLPCAELAIEPIDESIDRVPALGRVLDVPVDLHTSPPSSSSSSSSTWSTCCSRYSEKARSSHSVG